MGAVLQCLRENLPGRQRQHIDTVALEPLVDGRVRRAAVLIALLDRGRDVTVLFVERTHHVPTHKGQIAFPGGALEAGEDANQAAVREAHEEVALSPASVELLGELDDMLTITSYVVTPVVGVVRHPPADYTLQAFEVERAFEVPLSHLLDPAHMRMERWSWSRVPEGAPMEALRRTRLPDVQWNPDAEGYPMFFFDTPGGTIWGVTAFILRQFLVSGFGFDP